MSHVIDFMFNNLSRIGQDEYNHTQDNKVNNAYSSYMLTNMNNVNERNAFTLASSHPTMNIKGTHSVGPLGHNVNDSTNLINSKLTNLNQKISLQERTFKTVPFLGRGNVDVALENNLKFGETLREKKTDCKLNESCHNDIKKFPMDRALKEKYSNGGKFVEENVVKGWVRGGLPSRELYKNNEYQCN